jgi:ribosomal-protein-alanine N-acetyltransferase
MILQTERLHIIPLSYGQMEKYVRHDLSLEAELELMKFERIVSERMRQKIITKVLPAMIASRGDYLFHTFWMITDRHKNTAVAEFCFKGKPDARNEVEIGYETYKAFRGSGYMSEAVDALTTWAAKHPDVKSVLAETDPANLASQKVLLKNGFVNVGADSETIRWRKELRA